MCDLVYNDETAVTYVSSSNKYRRGSVTDETELKLALSAVTIRFIRGIVPLQVHSRVTPAPRHSTPLISIIWNGANRYSVPKRSCGQKKISFRLKNIESGNVQK